MLSNINMSYGHVIEKTCESPRDLHRLKGKEITPLISDLTKQALMQASSNWTLLISLPERTASKFASAKTRQAGPFYDWDIGHFIQYFDVRLKLASICFTI